MRQIFVSIRRVPPDDYRPDNEKQAWNLDEGIHRSSGTLLRPKQTLER
jgi:hypothetical protein